MSDLFADLPRGHFGAILADPPWHFAAWAGGAGRWNGDKHKRVYTPARAPAYDTMSLEDIEALPVVELVARDCILFIWGVWYHLPAALEVISAWGFKYKTCAFNWQKADVSQSDMFKEPEGQWGLGYWVRQNSEFCLLATRGSPKRLNANVRQGIIEPRREHSRKPDCVHERIERLVAGPYLELFARQQRLGWTCWGNETDKFRTPKPLTIEQRRIDGASP